MFSWENVGTNGMYAAAIMTRSYGREDLTILLYRFYPSIGDDEREKIYNDYNTLKDRLITEEFQYCKTGFDVCSKIARDSIFARIFPELKYLCCVALVIPFSSAWPERGFSTLVRIKTKQRNRIGAEMLNALLNLNVSINGPKSLSNEDATSIANNWLKAKDRRVINRVESGLNTSTSEADDDYNFSNDYLDLYETTQFVL